MSGRPWVKPSEVRAYSSLAEVLEREDTKLEVDIARAENYVIRYTNNKFEDTIESEEVSLLPKNVKIAVILVAEAYAFNAAKIAKQNGIKSETFDEYAYTKADIPDIDLTKLGLAGLLDEHIVIKAAGRVKMRLQAL